MLRFISPKSLVAVCLVCLGMAGTAATVRADEKDKVEAIGSDLCKAVRSMSGDPILKSHSINGDSLTMEVNWFGAFSELKYTSKITITFEAGGKIGKIKYTDDCGFPAYDLTYVEKWRQAQNKRK